MLYTKFSIAVECHSSAGITEEYLFLQRLSLQKTTGDPNDVTTICSFITSSIVFYPKSFCNFTATFAVEVSGSPEYPVADYIVILLTLFLGMVVLVVSYCVHRYLLYRVNWELVNYDNDQNAAD